MNPPCMGYRRTRSLGVLRVLFLNDMFSGFDTPIGLAGDVDGERRVLEAIPDGVEDDGSGGSHREPRLAGSRRHRPNWSFQRKTVQSV